MSQICQITGKRPLVGNTVSHANNKTKRRFNVNLHTKRFWVDSMKKFITLRVSSRGMRVIDKVGIETIISNMASYSSDIQE